jgi:1,4-alpha-glucan branching enzyme
MISPRTISITPLKLVPVAGVVLLFALVSAVLMYRWEQPTAMREASNPGIPVRFSLALAGARSVAVIGTFNEWQEEGFRMRWDEGRREWQLLVRVPAGRHEYAFLVDDERVVPDPAALFQQEDGFGNRNAVLIVGNGHENSI